MLENLVISTEYKTVLVSFLDRRLLENLVISTEYKTKALHSARRLLLENLVISTEYKTYRATVYAGIDRLRTL